MACSAAFKFKRTVCRLEGRRPNTIALIENHQSSIGKPGRQGGHRGMAQCRNAEIPGVRRCSRDEHSHDLAHTPPSTPLAASCFHLCELVGTSSKQSNPWHATHFGRTQLVASRHPTIMNVAAMPKSSGPVRKTASNR